MSMGGTGLDQRKRRTMEIWVDNPNMSFNDIAKAAGVSLSTFYRYRHDEEFMAEYHKLCQKRFDSLEAKAVDALEAQLDTGAWNAVKYILDSLGYKPTDKIEADLTTDVVVNIGE